MRPARWSPRAAAALALVAASILGCSPGDGGKGGARKPRIAGLVFQADQFFRLVRIGMREAAGKAGVELLEADTDNKPDKEFSLVSTYAAQQVDAIVISPLSREGSVAALKAAHDRNIKVVCYNTTVSADIPAAYVESSQGDLGGQTGRAAKAYIESKLGGRARIAILAFKTFLPEQSDGRVNGFKKEVGALPGAAIVSEQDAWLPEDALKRAGNILTAHPDVDLIWAANEGGTVGAVMAVQTAGRAGKVRVFGTDVSEQLLGFLLSPDDILQAVTAQRPVDLGRTAVESAVKAMKGEPVEKRVSLPGIHLSRSDPAAVQAYEKQLKAWIGR
jgi:simple sugar transport system substrate-binding protein/ribose transport system substrate-binding protein